MTPRVNLTTFKANKNFDSKYKFLCHRSIPKNKLQFPPWNAHPILVLFVEAAPKADKFMHELAGDSVFASEEAGCQSSVIIIRVLSSCSLGPRSPAL